MPNNDHNAASGSLGYGSESLAALLNVFTQWGSADFIRTLAHGPQLANRLAPNEMLDSTSVVAITTLARHGAMRPSELADHLRVGASNVSKISARLTELGLLRRVQDPNDSRAALLRLTDAGQAVMADFIEAGDNMMSEILSDWPSTDRATFARLLLRFENDAARFAERRVHEEKQG